MRSLDTHKGSLGRSPGTTAATNHSGIFCNQSSIICAISKFWEKVGLGAARAKLTSKTYEKFARDGPAAF